MKYSPLIAENPQARKRPTAVYWRMDETYIKVKGKWTYYYRAIDKFGKTLDFMLSEYRDDAAATTFFTCVIGNNGGIVKLTIPEFGRDGFDLDPRIKGDGLGTVRWKGRIADLRCGCETRRLCDLKQTFSFKIERSADLRFGG